MLRFREVLQTAELSLFPKVESTLGHGHARVSNLSKGGRRQAFISLVFLIAFVLVHSVGPKKFCFLLVTFDNDQPQSTVTSLHRGWALKTVYGQGVEICEILGIQSLHVFVYMNSHLPVNLWKVSHQPT